jgi:hypothetical protein
MKKALFAYLILASFTSDAQKGKFDPFKMVVLQPDTAVIDPSLYGDIDSVQAAQIRSYYSTIKQMEHMLNFKDYPPEMAKQFEETKESIKKRLPLLKAQEAEVKRFRYFQTLSDYSTQVYNFYYNEYEPFSTIVQYPAQKTEVSTLRHLADSLKADYIVFFSNIHTQMRDDFPFLRLTTSLYSHKENRIILTKETEGDTNSRGDRWTCGPTKLSCLLINGVRTSTDEVAPEIAKRQLRN